MTDTDKLNQLIDIVIDVRVFQREYFKGRDNDVLKSAKRKEAELDKWLAAHAMSPEPTQSKMF